MRIGITDHKNDSFLQSHIVLCKAGAWTNYNVWLNLPWADLSACSLAASFSNQRTEQLPIISFHSIQIVHISNTGTGLATRGQGGPALFHLHLTLKLGFPQLRWIVSGALLSLPPGCEWPSVVQDHFTPYALARLNYCIFFCHRIQPSGFFCIGKNKHHAVCFQSP